MPLLSLIMPMHNAQRHVRAALRSVLADRDVPMQVIVVDDQSTDRSAAIVRQFGDQRINMIPGPGTGIADAFNAGLAVATGQVVMRCDADDLYPPGRIQRQLAFLQQHPDFGAVCGAFDAIDSTGQQVSDLNHSEDACEITDELRDGQTRTHLCTFAVRTEHLRRLGGCRSYFVTAEDVDLQLRLPMACRVWYEPECAYHYRLHDASITHRQADPVRRFYEETARLFAQQ